MRMTEAQVGSEIANPCHLKLTVVSSVAGRPKRWRWRRRSSKDGTMEVLRMQDTESRSEVRESAAIAWGACRV